MASMAQTGDRVFKATGIDKNLPEFGKSSKMNNFKKYVKIHFRIFSQINFVIIFLQQRREGETWTHGTKSF